MLLRRIIVHVKTQNWTAVGLDFGIVVIGVFMGLQVQEWAQANKERALESSYISRLHVEVMDLEAVRRLVVRFRENGFDGLQNAVIKLSDPEGGPLTPFECTAIAVLLPTTNPTDDLPLVLELLSSGRLTIFKDERLEKALGDFLILRARTRDSRAGIAETIPRIGKTFGGSVAANRNSPAAKRLKTRKSMAYRQSSPISGLIRLAGPGSFSCP